VFGGVYKLVAVEEDGEIEPRIKISENVEKVTNPHFKKTVRFFDKDTNKAIGDVIMLHDEYVDESKPYRLCDPVYGWKQKKIENYYTRELQVPVFRNGQCVYTLPNIEQIRDYCKEQLNTLWSEILRIENPHAYHVDLSEELNSLKKEMLWQASANLEIHDK
jgi:nicotinate phosphoribosyltransferase